MKNILLFLFSALFCLNLSAQKVNAHLETYSQAGILSFSQVSDSGQSISSLPRFTFLGNYGRNVHIDFGKHFGFFTGLESKNVGFITKNEQNLKIKRRIYGIGIPLALKIGNFEKWYVYGGAEYQYAFNYKMKTFDDKGNKTKYQSSWGGTETPNFLPSAFVGLNWKSLDIKLQYYFQNFINSEKTAINAFNPAFMDIKDSYYKNYYKNYNANVFLIQVGIRGDFIKKWLQDFTKTPAPAPAVPKKRRDNSNV